MATNFKHWDSDGEYGTHYLFDAVGEGIGMHAHVKPATWHDTRCLKGSVEIYGDGIEAVLHAGERLDFPSYRQHELRALEPGTEIVNVFLNGLPDGYAGLTEADTRGAVESVLAGRIPFPTTSN